ncbi:hypothetical protein BHE74_00048344 [Ensete ventricosum]|nr:hypothetical protein BHE74_00048344 [Ensete ventricosum]
MLDFDRRRPILGGISRGRKKKREKYKKEKKRENMEIWHCSPDLDLSPASFLALREENLRRSRGENDARASSTHVGFLGRRRFFSPHGEKKCFPAWGEGTRRHCPNRRIVTFVEEYSDREGNEVNGEPKYDDDKEEVTYADHGLSFISYGECKDELGRGDHVLALVVVEENEDHKEL